MNKISKRYHEAASFQSCIGYRETRVGTGLLQQDTCVYAAYANGGGIIFTVKTFRLKVDMLTTRPLRLSKD